MQNTSSSTFSEKYAKEAFEDNELALLEKGDIQGELNSTTNCPLSI